MPKPEDRFDLIISIEPVKVNEDGSRSSYGATTQHYRDMAYGDMVQAQRAALMALVEALTGMGMAIAEGMKQESQKKK